MWQRVTKRALKCMGVYDPTEEDVATFGTRINIVKLPKRWLFALWLVLPFVEKLIVNKGKVEWEVMMQDFDDEEY